MKIKKSILKYYILVFITYIITFYPLLENLSVIFTYWDELFILLFIIELFTHKFKIKCSKHILNSFKYLFIFIVFGILCSVKFSYQNSFAVFEDIVSFLKFPSAIYFSIMYFNGNEINNNSKSYNRHLNIITFSLLILLIINNFINYYPVENKNIIFFRGEQLIYSHQTYLAASIAFLISISIQVCNKRRIDKLRVLALIIIGLSTTRSKMIAWLMTLLIVYIVITKLNKRIKIRHIFPIIITLFLVAREKIYYYFVVYRDVARGALYSTGIKVMKDYFPFGAGFATFGSSASAKYYSPLYFSYGLNNIYGFFNINKGANYISDTFWPILFAETGIFGTLFYILFIISLIVEIQKISKLDKYIYLSAISSFMYLMIISVAESAFVNPISVPFGLLIGISIKRSFIKLKN